MNELKNYLLQSKLVMTSVGFATAALIGIFDHLNGRQLSFSILYFSPIYIVVKCVGKWPGILVSVACTLVWLFTDLLHGPEMSGFAFLYWNAAVRLSFLLIFTLLLASLENALARERQLSSFDALTKIRNSRSFRELAGLEIERAKRYDRPLSFAYVDVDDFKKVNDRFGHQQGDVVLQLVAQTMQANVRNTDLVGRLGGDEFGLLLPETDAAAAEDVVRRLRVILANEVKASIAPVTLSVGLVTFSRPTESIEELLSKADELMYAVKHDAKDGFKCAIVSANEAGVSVPSG